MKNYRITVNGVAYDVAVEELGAGEASAAPVSATCSSTGTSEESCSKDFRKCRGRKDYSTNAR